MPFHNVPNNHNYERLRAEIVNILDSRPWGSAAPMVICARSMNISARTLRRRLAENQTTFSEVFENWRIANAKRLLSERNEPIASISAILGYNHQSNFERAFKRWAGVSPTCYRAHRENTLTSNDNSPNRH